MIAVLVVHSSPESREKAAGIGLPAALKIIGDALRDRRSRENYCNTINILNRNTALGEGRTGETAVAEISPGGIG